jgi:exosortase A
MSAELATVPSSALTVGAPRSANRVLLTIVASAGVIALLFHETLWSMIALWARSQTFAHGFVIVPISAWLIWRQRDRLAQLPLHPNYTALLLLAFLGAAWLLAAAANVQVVMQYAVTAMIPAAVLVMCGRAVAQAIAFPLAYLLLAVPFGEIFIAPLIDFTANFTVGALQLSGIPVFREGNQFSIPSGNWSVVEACSGLRYVIASFALGTLYAYLNYQGWMRRLIFIVASMVVPILANGMRAYLIVMLGHWSGMQLAVGFDHLIYGWAFFGLVCLLLFWIGSFWQQSPEPRIAGAATILAAPKPARAGIAVAAAAGIAVSACWPVLAALLLQAAPTRPGSAAGMVIVAPALRWQETDGSGGQWLASHAGQPLKLQKNYIDGHQPDRSVSLQVVWYDKQQKNAELLTHVAASSSARPFYEVDNRTRRLKFGAQALSVRQSILRSNATYLLVWRWYRQSGIDTHHAFVVKYLLAQNKLLHLRQDGAEIIVAAAFDNAQEQAQAEALLQQFLASMLPAIHQGLNHVTSQ